MTTKDILKTLSEFDGAAEASTNNNLLDDLDDIERSVANLRTLLIYARIKKIMYNTEPKATDIYVQTMAKAGTTLGQMILYQMTTDGKMDFKHIYDVSPWYGIVARKGSTFKAFLNNPPKFDRKIIKSHTPYEMFKDFKKGKIVYIIRDGKDLLLSNYHQHKNYFEYKEDFEQFVNKHMPDWFNVNEEWLKNKYKLPIIYINYEDILNKKRAVILKLADFLDIQINEKLINRTIERTSFSFMKKHETKFGEQPQLNDNRIYDQFIRKGKVGEGRNHFTEEQINRYADLSKSYLSTHDLSKRYFEN